MHLDLDSAVDWGNEDLSVHWRRALLFRSSRVETEYIRFRSCERQMTIGALGMLTLFFALLGIFQDSSNWTRWGLFFASLCHVVALLTQLCLWYSFRLANISKQQRNARFFEAVNVAVGLLSPVLVVLQYTSLDECGARTNSGNVCFDRLSPEVPLLLTPMFYSLFLVPRMVFALPLQFLGIFAFFAGRVIIHSTESWVLFFTVFLIFFASCMAMVATIAVREKSHRHSFSSFVTVGICKESLARLHEQRGKILLSLYPVTVARRILAGTLEGNIEVIDVASEASMMCFEILNFNLWCIEHIPFEIASVMHKIVMEADRILDNVGATKLHMFGEHYLAVLGLDQHVDEALSIMTVAAQEIFQRVRPKIVDEGLGLRVCVHSGSLAGGLFGFRYEVGGKALRECLAMMVSLSGDGVYVLQENCEKDGRFITAIPLTSEVDSTTFQVPPGSSSLNDEELAGLEQRVRHHMASSVAGINEGSVSTATAPAMFAMQSFCSVTINDAEMNRKWKLYVGRIIGTNIYTLCSCQVIGIGALLICTLLIWSSFEIVPICLVFVQFAIEGPLVSRALVLKMPLLLQMVMFYTSMAVFATSLFLTEVKTIHSAGLVWAVLVGWISSTVYFNTAPIVRIALDFPLFCVLLALEHEYMSANLVIFGLVVFFLQFLFRFRVFSELRRQFTSEQETMTLTSEVARENGKLQKMIQSVVAPSVTMIFYNEEATIGQFGFFTEAENKCFLAVVIHLDQKLDANEADRLHTLWLAYEAVQCCCAPGVVWVKSAERKLLLEGTAPRLMSTALNISCNMLHKADFTFSTTLGCGPVTGAIVGQSRVSYEFFGASISTTWQILDATPVGGITAMESFVNELHQYGSTTACVEVSMPERPEPLVIVLHVARAAEWTLRNGTCSMVHILSPLVASKNEEN